MLTSFEGKQNTNDTVLITLFLLKSVDCSQVQYRTRFQHAGNLLYLLKCISICCKNKEKRLVHQLRTKMQRNYKANKANKGGQLKFIERRRGHWGVIEGLTSHRLSFLWLANASFSVKSLLHASLNRIPSSASSNISRSSSARNHRTNS